MYSTAENLKKTMFVGLNQSASWQNLTRVLVNNESLF